MSATGAARVVFATLFAIASAAIAAPAADAPLVVISDGQEEPATTGAAVRLVAELELVGLRAQLATADAGAVPAARVLLDVARGHVEVTFFDGGSGQPTLHQLLDASPTGDMAALLVVRTVELVRAVLLPTPAAAGRPSPPALPPAAPTTAVTSSGARATSRVAVALTSGAVLTPAGADVAATLALTARLHVAGAFGVELSTFAPLTSHATSTLEGRSDVSTWLAGAGVFARAAARRLAVDVAVGGLALWLRTDGTPAPGYATTGASGLGAALYARTGAALPLGSQLAARVDLLAGALARRPVVAFPDSGERPAWGRTFCAALAGLEARWD